MTEIALHALRNEAAALRSHLAAERQDALKVRLEDFNVIKLQKITSSTTSTVCQQQQPMFIGLRVGFPVQ